MDRGRPVLLLTRDALRSGPQASESGTQEPPEETTLDTEQSEADEIAARLRAAAGTLLRAGTTTTAPLPDDVSRSARVVERQGRLVLCDKGFPRFVPEGRRTGWGGAPRIALQNSNRDVTGGGASRRRCSGARHRTHPPLSRHRLASPRSLPSRPRRPLNSWKGEAQPSESTVTEMMP